MLQIVIVSLGTLATGKPIMVTFGTNQGPIVPRQPKSTAAQERTIEVRNPAPVSEAREDVPNPNDYRAPEPHQYRTKLYAVKPPANLILGTPLDIKYTPYLEKYSVPKKNYARELRLGVDYTGPQFFERQDYEIAEQKTALRPSVRYTRPVFTPRVEKRVQNDDDYHSKYVPQIGVIYSSGVRYYVPQIVYYDRKNAPNPEDENSVYDAQDEKYYKQ